MPRPLSPLGLTALALLAVLASGCARVRDHKGYVIDQALLESVQPGVDNRASVTKTLGRPSFASEFDGGRTWYYLARDTRSLAFGRPRAVSQTLLTVRFDPGGNVASVGKSGMERVAEISPSGDKTPTLGVHRGFFGELFGNIGRVGSVSPAGGTSDNPTGGTPGG